MTQLKSNKNEGWFPSVFSDFFDSDRFFDTTWMKNFPQSMPAVNIKETDSEFDVEFAAPGFKKDDFKISVDDNILTISAEKKEEKTEGKDKYTRKEFSYNSFSRSFSVPKNVMSDRIDAKYNDGILKLCIPKKEEAKSAAKREIKVG